jgi:hypothetical protein
MSDLEAYLRQCKARAKIKETISDEQFRFNFEALSTSLGVAAMRDPVVYGLARVFSARADFEKETCLVAMVRQLVENKFEMCERYAEMLNRTTAPRPEVLR